MAADNQLPSRQRSVEPTEEQIADLARALHAEPGPHEPGFHLHTRRGGFDSMHPFWQEKYREHARRVLVAMGQQEEQR